MMRSALGRVELAWLTLCIGGWLVLSFAFGESQAECDAKGEWLCFSTKDMLVLVGIYGLALWAVGAVVIGAIYAFHRWLWRRPSA